jgi:3-phytase
LILAACGSKPAATVAEKSGADGTIRAAFATDPVSDDPDDPAVWVNPADAGASLILGTNKVRRPQGALVVYGLDGKTRQTIANLDRPNNVDVEYGLRLNGKSADIAVVTERRKRRLRVFSITASGLRDATGVEAITVFDGEQGEASEPMGIALYRRPKDGAIFAIVGRKNGPKDGYLWQYRLEDDGTGKVSGVKVRQFGAFSGSKEIEAIAVDDALGYVYYADEDNGIRKWHADPDHPDAARELAHFGRSGFQGNREGIAVYSKPDGTGYIVCTDQVGGNSRYVVFRREGAPGKPHDHSEVVKVVRGGADSTDGLEVISTPLGASFPHGLMIAMNAAPRNFLVFRWDDIGLPQ